MDWTAFALSIRLSVWTTVILFFIALVVARILAWRQFPGKSLVEAIVALPLVLPPTVLGYYMLVAFGRESAFGRAIEELTGLSLVFSFSGLLLASVIYSFPFAVQPMIRAFESIPTDLREAAWCSGLSRWKTFRLIEFPLALPGILTAMVLTFAHTMGEFGVVLMVGGGIPGETKTASIAIFDSSQAFDDESAGLMSLVLLIFSFVTVSLVYSFNHRRSKRALS